VRLKNLDVSAISTRFQDILVFGRIVAMKKIFLTAIITATVLCNWAVAQTPTPTPYVTPMPPTIEKQVQTLADLQSRIRSRLLSPDLRRGQVGVKIVSLNSGQVIFEQNSEKYFMPASNMKNFTVATAIEKLTPDFHFVTSVYAAAGPGLRVGDWRGRRVQVCGSGSCVVVTLVDWCACAGGGRLIDLYSDAYRRLAPLSTGTLRVKVSW